MSIKYAVTKNLDMFGNEITIDECKERLMNEILSKYVVNKDSITFDTYDAPTKFCKYVRCTFEGEEVNK